jgi:hypothetical protein
MTKKDRTWFDNCIFDRYHYQLLKPHHPHSTAPYVLSVNPYLWLVSSIVAGILLTLLIC